jgi:hypothetical protein
MPAERGEGVATVVRQDGERLLVRDPAGGETAVPLAGFPKGFQLRPGQRVALIQEPTGLVARPLVIARTVRATPQTLASGTVEIGGQAHVLQPASVRAELLPGERAASDQYDVWIVDHGSAEGPRQIIAIRPEHTRRRR